jgi:hypothetical protein
MPDDTPRLILQRIRNRIIDNLDTLSSFEEQREYARRVPICYVPYELINSWADWVDSPRPAGFIEPVFSSLERGAIERFYSYWLDASEALPEDYPPLTEVQKAPYWALLRDAAQEARAVFHVRGRLPEDVEAL